MNVLLMLADDLGYGDVSYNNPEFIETKNIDALKEESIAFNDFHSAPLCAPSRAAILTGKDFLKTGVWHVHGGRDFIHRDIKLLPEYLKEKGYKTGIFGKWHSGKTSGYLPHQRGFDESYMARLYVNHNNDFNYNGNYEPIEGWTSDVISDLAMDFMEKSVKEKKPFFTYVPFLAPHEPWEAPKEYIDKYFEKGLSNSMSTLYGMIDHMDHNVGRILNKVKELNIEEETLIMFLSDNGPIGVCGLNDNLTADEMSLRNPRKLRGTKGDVFENGNLVPCLMKVNGSNKKLDIHDTLHITDIFSTIMEYCKIDLDNIECDGYSLIPYSNDGKAEGIEERIIFDANHSLKIDGYDYSIYEEKPYRYRRYEFYPYRDKRLINFEIQDHMMYARDQTFKFIASTEEDKLYNIKLDEREINNLKDTNVEKYQYLKERSKSWFEGVVEEKKSFQIASMQVGFDGEKTSHIPMYAIADCGGGVVPNSHTTRNWKNKGDFVDINIHVCAKGYYDVELLASRYEKNTHLEITLGEERLEHRVSRFKQFFGTVYLEEGDSKLRVALTKVPEGDNEKVVFDYKRGGINLHRKSE